MNFANKKPAGHGPRTLAQVLYEPRSDRPSVEDFGATLGEAAEVPAAASAFAHRLLGILAGDPALAPAVVLYGLAHAWADMALAIGGEMLIEDPCEMLAEIGFPPLLEGIPKEAAMRILALGTRAVMRNWGTTPEQEIAAYQARNAAEAEAQEARDTISDPFPASEAN